MTTLNRSALVSTPTFLEDFTTQPTMWVEQPRGAGKFRLKYDHSGDTPMARGLGMQGETEIYSNQSYLGGLVGSPHSYTGSSWKLTASPASDAAKAAVAASVPSTYAGAKIPHFVSGMMSTEGSFFQQYGYYEMRSRETPCVGSWSAFWLMGAHGCPWQEIDVFERLGGDPDKIYCTSHTQIDPYGAILPAQKAQSKAFTGVTASDFHTTGVLWTPQFVAWYVDDVERWRINNPGIHQPMMMIANLAMDGDWNKGLGFVAADDATASLEIDFIKAWQIR